MNPFGNFKSTYRFQLHKDFTFTDVKKLLPYLESLGISHLYLSPILESRPGSTHGYDGIDPLKVSGERGGEKEFKSLVNALQTYARKPGKLKGIILDIVPNHLATDFENPYWRDALQAGTKSPYYRSFDIRSKPTVIPILGGSLNEVLQKKELKVKKSRDGHAVLHYYGEKFPLQLTKGRTFEELKDPRKLQALLKKQSYTLEDWRTGIKKLNYRRFFDINHLIGMRVENEKVFQWTHEKIFELMKKFPSIEGLRVDHVDGLFNPRQYLERLTRQCPNVWVEKILHDDEGIPSAWPIHGSTGYEFAVFASKVFVADSGFRKIHDFYCSQINTRWKFFSDCVYESKKEMLHLLFESEFRSLLNDILSYADQARIAHPFETEALETAFEELTLGLKTYRIYHQPSSDAHLLGQDDRMWLFDAYESALARGNLASRKPIEWLVEFFSDESDHSPEKKKLLGRWQQLTGPVTAKGLEDTALYRYAPLLAQNSVGGQPDLNYNPVTEFHVFSQEKLKNHPLSMNTTTTHDTKRNEDVQTRLQVLSELPEKWIAFFEKVSGINRKLKSNVVSPATEYFIYQTLVGVWPLDHKITGSFRARMKEYFTKALREAKLETNWLAPNAEYEASALGFVQELLSSGSKRFQKEISKLADECAYFGALNSLGLCTLRYLSPGLPDLYQGTETWSYYLVDPDNRLPVDYQKLNRFSQNAIKNDSQGTAPIDKAVLKNWKSGEVKFRLIRSLLKLRQRSASQLERAKYLPLQIEGAMQEHVIAFARMMENEWMVVVIPRLLASVQRKGVEMKVASSLFADTRILLPIEAPAQWFDYLGASREVKALKQKLNVAELLRISPIGVFRSVPDQAFMNLKGEALS